MRGVPLLDAARRAAASSSTSTPMYRRRAMDDRFELVDLVVAEAQRYAEAAREGRRYRAGLGRRSYEGEWRHGYAHRSGGGPLPYHPVELEVLHRDVEHLFYRRLEPMYLVDEKDRAFA